MPPTRMQKASTSSRRARQAVVSKKRASWPTPMQMAKYQPKRRKSFKYNGVTYYKGIRSRNRAIFSKSSGFFKTGRPTKKYRQRSKYVYKGVTQFVEASSVTTDPECVYITHSVPLYRAKYCAWWAVMKHLFTRAGAFVFDFSDARTLVSCGSNTGDIIRLVYKGTSDAATANDDFTVAIGSTVNDLVTSFANDVLLDGDGIQLIELRYLTVQPATTLNSLNQTIIRMEGALIDMEIKMDLKMQNRTIPAVGLNDSEDVSNQPLYGKIYQGTGIGPRPKSAIFNTGVSLSANVNTGAIALGAASMTSAAPINNPVFNEPLDYQYYTNVSKIGKAHIDPGQLKTSVLSKRFVFVFGNFLNIVNPQLNDAGSNVVSGDKSFVPKKLAEFRTYAVEKMIDATGTPTNVVVAWEHNVKISAVFRPRSQTSSSISFVKARI